MPAAKARVRRAGWHRIKGNDGVMRVEAPVAALTASPPTLQATLPPTEPPTASPVLPVDHTAMAALVDELRAERDLARAEANKLRREMDGLRERAGEVGPLREALADLSARLDRAEEYLRRPWWKRLFG
jgi:CelD/BcsL family acetyltransferase involved in cellulose biosynthesis